MILYYLMGTILFLASIFMMLLILVQRGRGGGLTGALGGMGGQSAFGSRAGDVFTRVTVITAIVWIMLCMITIAYLNPPKIVNKSEKPSISSNLENMTDSNTIDLRTIEDESDPPESGVVPSTPSGVDGGTGETSDPVSDPSVSDPSGDGDEKSNSDKSDADKNKDDKSGEPKMIPPAGDQKSNESKSKTDDKKNENKKDNSKLE